MRSHDRKRPTEQPSYPADLSLQNVVWLCILEHYSKITNPFATLQALIFWIKLKKMQHFSNLSCLQCAVDVSVFQGLSLGYERPLDRVGRRSEQIKGQSHYCANAFRKIASKIWVFIDMDSKMWRTPLKTCGNA